MAVYGLGGGLCEGGVGVLPAMWACVGSLRAFPRLSEVRSSKQRALSSGLAFA